MAAMNNGATTFVMPAYNAGEYIECAVKSVMAQTFSEWKLIIVDDCSTDDTLKIAKRLAKDDSRISVIPLSANTGNAFIPRNIAIMQSDTPWVSQLDADDWVPANYLEELLKIQVKYGADAVYPTLEVMDGTRVINRVPEKIEVPCDSGRNYFKLTLNGWKINTAGGIIRAEYYKQAINQFENTRIHTYSDELLSRLLIVDLPKVALSAVPYYYRNTTGSVTRKLSTKSFDIIRNNTYLIDFTRETFGNESEEYSEAQLQNFYYILDAFALLHNNSFTKEDKFKIKNLIGLAKQKTDLKIIKAHAARKYYLLYYCSPWLTGKLLGIRNLIKKNKKQRDTSQHQE